MCEDKGKTCETCITLFEVINNLTNISLICVLHGRRTRVVGLDNGVNENLFQESIYFEKIIKYLNNVQSVICDTNFNFLWTHFYPLLNKNSLEFNLVLPHTS